MEQCESRASRVLADLRANLLEIGLCLVVVVIAAIAPALTRDADSPEQLFALVLGPLALMTALYLRIRMGAAARQSRIHQRARQLAVARGEQDAVVSDAVVKEAVPAKPLRHWMVWLPPILVTIACMPHRLAEVLEGSQAFAVTFFAIASFVAMLFGVLGSVVVLLPIEAMTRASLRLLRVEVSGHGLAVSFTFITLVAGIAFASSRAVVVTGSVLSIIPAYLGVSGEYLVLSQPWLWVTRVLILALVALVLAAIRAGLASSRGAVRR